MSIALIRQQFGNTRYLARALELLDDGESEVSDSELGVVITTPIGGAASVTKLQLLLGDSALLSTLTTARLVFAEVPDDSPWSGMTSALLANGFREEGRIDHFVADGIALRIFVRR